jgi:large subunit ribosomal protein L1
LKYRSKRYRASLEKIDKRKMHSLGEAVKILKELPPTKFDQAVDVAVRLGVDPRHADQNVRGTVRLPHGVGKKIRVLVLTKGKEKEALEAGADLSGFDEYIEKIKGGWTDIDVIIATPDVMSEVSKLGKILGPRGLMPNPKSGTVTQDIPSAVKEVKAGKIEFRVDKTGILHASIGKISFDQDKLLDNVKAFLHTVVKLKPASAKGQYIKSISMSTTMGPGIRIDRAETAQ